MNKLQAKILDIYLEIKKICERNNIRFFAIGGTAIGAERHNGFIPWDDDLDIAIPNNDYDDFLDCCSKELPSYLKVFDYHDSRHCLIFWDKVHDSRTTFLEKNTIDYKDYHYGVFVDVMPMYGVPDNIESYNRVVRRYRILNSLRQNSFKQFTSFAKKAAKILFFPLNLFIPRTYWLKKLDKYQSKWSFDDSENVGYTWHTLFGNLVFKKEWFDDYIEIPFERTTMRCCRGNKEMLRKQFGDYLELPPKNERVSNHYVEIIDLKRSYDEYDQKRRG